MLPAISKHVKDVSVLRRLLFALSQLPNDLPDVWKLAVEFATKGKEGSIEDSESTKLMLKNLEEIDISAFLDDKSLFFELLATPFSCNKSLGVALVPPMIACLLCGSNLQLRKDRPAAVALYDDNVGTIPGSHFHKICKNRLCGYTQYYGYYTLKGSTQVFFNRDWECLPYFVSSWETVFSKASMQRFETEILLGQLSFKQCAEIYNQIHKCSILHLPSASRLVLQYIWFVLFHTMYTWFIHIENFLNKL